MSAYWRKFLRTLPVLMVAAGAGAIAALGTFHGIGGQLSGPLLVLAVVVPVIVVLLVSVALRLEPGRHSISSQAQPGHPPDAAPRPGEDAPLDPQPAREPLLPENPPVTTELAVPGGMWWNLAPAGRVPPDSPTATPVPAPPLSQYGSVAWLAQCPECGSFRITADVAPSDLRFGCLACDASWRWCRGQDWPPTTIRPPRRRPARSLNRAAAP